MKNWKMIYRWSIFTSSLTALLWTIYYLIAGNVPTVEIPINFNDPSIVISVSRWWDILIGPICSIIIILIWAKRDELESNDYAELITFFIVLLGLIGIIWGAGISLIGLTIIGVIFVAISSIIIILSLLFIIIFLIINSKLGKWLLDQSS
ncbi:MAG: hypothetical protein PHW50_01920 [Patescibacteria group bacterium]|nr:hypothetical protein [Patescibacteria group bacterium]